MVVTGNDRNLISACLSTPPLDGFFLSDLLYTLFFITADSSSLGLWVLDYSRRRIDSRPVFFTWSFRCLT